MEGICREVKDLLDGGDESLKTSNMEASETTPTSYIGMFYRDTGAAQTRSQIRTSSSHFNTHSYSRKGCGLTWSLSLPATKSILSNVS